MRTSVVVESLDGRAHFAATPKLDPNYTATADALRQAAGDDVQLYQAIAGPGDRTYVLAQRYPKGTPITDQETIGLLTIAAYGPDGQLDSSFGTGGVALAGRHMLNHYSFDRPGVLKVDGVGRLYFADNTRVLRFHPDGTTDGSFGTHGAVTFASDDQPVGLCDIQPVDNGVLIATSKTVKGVERFAVQRAGAGKLTTVWEASHYTGISNPGRSGTIDFDESPATYTYENPADDLARFAASRGGIVLMRIEADYETYTQPDPLDDFGGPYETFGETAQHLVVTRFDAAGHGTDLVRATLRRPGEHMGTKLAGTGDDSAYDIYTNASPVLSPTGKTLVVQTQNEFVRLNLSRRQLAGRLSTGNPAFGPSSSDVFEATGQIVDHAPALLPDGSVRVITIASGENYARAYSIQKFALDFDSGIAKPVGGALKPQNRTLAATDTYVSQIQPLLGASGRFYLFSIGTIDGGKTTLALSRV